VEIADAAINYIETQLDPNRPFFFALGFNKPHIPFVAPSQDFDHYPVDFSMPESNQLIVNMPRVAWHPYGGLLDYADIYNLDVTGEYNTSIPEFKTKELRRAYYACVTFTDRQIGRVIEAFEQKNLLENTIIVFIGDHGFQLSEHLEWLKRTLYERSTRAPAFIRVPGLTDNGLFTQALTEHVDLFPTIIDLLNLPQIPACPPNSSSERLCTEGLSLKPLFYNPDATVKGQVFTQVYKEFEGVHRMGYTIRTPLFRYVEWPRYDMELFQPDWENVLAYELYDLVEDAAEDENVYGKPEYADIVSELSLRLRSGK